ncbi:MAG: pirin-like C-terminal cupin domain-containing protein [Pseudonocardiaceae bacterium]
MSLPLQSDFEHAVLTGAPEAADTPLGPGTLLYLGTGRHELRLRADALSRMLLLGGEPFAEQIVMWWKLPGHHRPRSSLLSSAVSPAVSSVVISSAGVH